MAAGQCYSEGKVSKQRSCLVIQSWKGLKGFLTCSTPQHTFCIVKHSYLFTPAEFTGITLTQQATSVEESHLQDIPYSINCMSAVTIATVLIPLQGCNTHESNYCVRESFQVQTFNSPSLTVITTWWYKCCFLLIWATSNLSLVNRSDQTLCFLCIK